MRTRFCCIICIFLCAIFSASGQRQPSLSVRDSALFWERAAFASDTPEAAQKALFRKAECLSRAALWEEARGTLERIRLYQLEDAELTEVLHLKALCCKETGAWEEALASLEEGGVQGADPAFHAVLLARNRRFAEAREAALICAGDDPVRREAVMRLFEKTPRGKKEKTAAFLSLVPPAGQLYLGRPGEGLLSMALNAGAAGFTAWQLAGGNWVTGLLGGGMLLMETYYKGNLNRNLSRVEKVDEDAVSAFVQSLETLLESFIS